MTSPAFSTAGALGSRAGSPDKAASQHRLLRLWLYCIAFLIFCMVIVGGATRLTDSGLSITEWKPLLGAIPPLTEADWREAFEKYRQIPEYKIINRGMSLEAFKTIYWWEWAHRFLGRFIGLAFLLPFVAFWAMGRIPKGLMPKLLGIFLLGGLQGALGWYMVMSGLSERTDVSQYRLTAHLGLAIVIFGAVLWTAFSLGRTAEANKNEAPRVLGLGAGVLAGAIFLQILLGGFVAGTDAGLSHNTWPLMDGALVPSGLFAMQPWYANLFENVMTVQFNHRMAAYLIALLVLAHAIRAWRLGSGPIRRSAMLLLAATLGQIALGVLALLSQLQIGVALAHQGGAVILFGLALHHLFLVRRS